MDCVEAFQEVRRKRQNVGNEHGKGVIALFHVVNAKHVESCVAVADRCATGAREQVQKLRARIHLTSTDYADFPLAAIRSGWASRIPATLRAISSMRSMLSTPFERR